MLVVVLSTIFKQTIVPSSGRLEEEVAVNECANRKPSFIFIKSLQALKERKTKLLWRRARSRSSDQYAVETIVKHYGLAPDQIIIELVPPTRRKILNTKDIVTADQNDRRRTRAGFVGRHQYLLYRTAF
jgi:kynureninase